MALWPDPAGLSYGGWPRGRGSKSRTLQAVLWEAFMEDMRCHLSLHCFCKDHQGIPFLSGNPTYSFKGSLPPGGMPVEERVAGWAAYCSCCPPIRPPLPVLKEAWHGGRLDGSRIGGMKPAQGWWSSTLARGRVSARSTTVLSALSLPPFFWNPIQSVHISILLVQEKVCAGRKKKNNNLPACF